jgi:CRISPR system Cascade subunit CasD
MRHLLFQLHGPLASWGEPAVGETRHSATHPGRSALLGLVCAALGVRREETERLGEVAGALRFASLTLRPGRPLTDFHTAQRPPSDRKGGPFRTRGEELFRDPSRLYTTISNREYRCDGWWLAATWTGDESDLLDQAAAALAQPVFPLYLGRKACPPDLPLAPRLLESETLQAAFADYMHDAEEEYLPNERVSYAWEGHPAPGLEETLITERTDEPLDRRRWHFAVRREHVCTVTKE